MREEEVMVSCGRSNIDSERWGGMGEGVEYDTILMWSEGRGEVWFHAEVR